MPDYEKELDKYEKSVNDHVQKVSLHLDEELANINQKYKEKTELLKQMELENKKMNDENERIRQRMEQRKKKIAFFEKQIIKNKDNQLTFEANIAEFHEKLPQRQKNIAEILKALNEKRHEVIVKQNEYASFQTNQTENSMKTKLGKTRKRLEEAKKKKISQDKRVSHLRSDIAKSEKSFDRIEQEIRKEIERQFENESKKEEIERRIKIFEVENAGISDEFGKLLVTLTQESDVREKSAEQRLGELQVMMAKGMKYLENLDQKIEKTRKMDWANQKNARIDRPGNQKLGIGNPSKRRSKSETSATKSWRRLEDLKKQIIQLKRESEALRNNRIKLIEEKDTLQKTMEACQRQADRAAQELRNAENFRISELTQQQRKLQPSILIETRVEKQNKNDVEKREKLREKVELLEKSREEKKEELERIIRRSDYLRRQLRSHSETDLVQFENDKTEKAAELRDLKKTYHEQVMMLNALNRKLQQRVFQREAAMTKANSVVHITTNVREERNREMEELRKEMAETRKKF